MIILAHDGSLYGDWLTCYAVNFAAVEDDRKLLALHVLDGRSSEELVTAKFAQLAATCQARNIDFSVQLLPLADGRYRSLRQAIPHEETNLLVCGTRTKVKKHALLQGSIAERLLRTHQSPVLALRVVQPGLLGAPQDLLLPLAGHAHGFIRIVPILKRLVPRLRRVHLCRVVQIPHRRQARLTHAQERQLLVGAQHDLQGIAEQIISTFPEKVFSLESQTLIAADWPNAILTQASRLKVQMILLGVSERNLAHKIFYGVGSERVLGEAPCDVGIYRAP